MGCFLAGVFENRQQARESPAWYVPLRLWIRPVPLFEQDSLTFFVEQANVLNVQGPYRSRLWRLRQLSDSPLQLVVDHYQVQDLVAWRGAAVDRNRLLSLRESDILLLSAEGCRLAVEISGKSPADYQFRAFPITDIPCQFCYQEKNYAIALGFIADARQLQTFDRGIDLETGKPTWGALMGPYCFQKLENEP
jgi:hypothetical protein